MNVEYDDENHANIMKMLIENEVNNVNDVNNYFAKIFDNVCDNRTYFAAKTFIEYDKNWPNVMDQVAEKLDEIYKMYCNKCNGALVIMDDIKENRQLKCVDCGTKASEECKQLRMISIRMIRKILKNENATYVTEIKEYSEIKLQALRIELLQEKKLL